MTIEGFMRVVDNWVCSFSKEGREEIEKAAIHLVSMSQHDDRMELASVVDEMNDWNRACGRREDTDMTGIRTRLRDLLDYLRWDHMKGQQ